MLNHLVSRHPNACQMPVTALPNGVELYSSSIESRAAKGLAGLGCLLGAAHRQR